MQSKLSVPSVLSTITQPWSPKLVANIDNSYDIKIAKIDGSFIWHAHPDADELFYLMSGALTLEIEGEKDVVLSPGDVFVVPRGVRHKPVAEKAEIMLIEKVGVVNTGDEEKSSLTKTAEDVRKTVG